MTGFPALWLALGVAYGAIGIAVALRLVTRGASRAASLAALGCWPLLLPLVFAEPAPTTTGPLGERIRACAEDLRRTMADPVADGLVVVEDLDELVADLQRADARLGLVDRLLADVGATARTSAGLHALRAARGRAAAEVEAVLDGMVELRLSIGLRSLAGNAVPVHERLQDLRARLGALDDMTDLELQLA